MQALQPERQHLTIQMGKNNKQARFMGPSSGETSGKHFKTFVKIITKGRRKLTAEQVAPKPLDHTIVKNPQQLIKHTWWIATSVRTQFQAWKTFLVGSVPGDSLPIMEGQGFSTIAWTKKNRVTALLRAVNLLIKEVETRCKRHSKSIRWMQGNWRIIQAPGGLSLQPPLTIFTRTCTKRIICSNKRTAISRPVSKGSTQTGESNRFKRSTH